MAGVSSSAATMATTVGVSGTSESEAFAITNPDDLNESRLELLMGRMRCLKGIMIFIYR